MKALLLVAHGSRREASNEEVRRLAQRLAERAAGTYDRVEAAFLELAEPSIPESIRRCAEAGATEVVVLPYFLSAGRHVSRDIPDAVKMAEKALPDLAVRLTPYLGAADGVVELLLKLATASRR